MSPLFKNIQPLFVSGKNATSRWVGYVGLFAGVFLFLLSIQAFITINDLLQENNVRKNGYDFISLSKTITNENMGKDNSFNKNDIALLKSQASIADVSPLISNQFRVRATAGDVLPFSTDLFLESLDNNFLDTLPPSFTWSQGQQLVPVIFSSDFLEMYNVFAPAQGLPQLSAKTISSVIIVLECAGPGGTQVYKGNIVALSDRINSILVPKSFMDYNNFRFSGDTTVHAARVYIKTKDAANPALINFLDQQNYHVNKDKIQFGRARGLLQNILSGLGIFGFFIILMAFLLFSFYQRLMIANSRDNLRLLLMLGYSPQWLARGMARSWIPVYFIIIFISLAVLQVIYFLLAQFPFFKNAMISPWLHWSVWLVAMILVVITAFLNFRMVRKEMTMIV